MTTQRFCLRWNNHQSNLLSVFDQLLHAETFTDVTLAVEGQYLRAHKMVLSACSPYFQALFTTHPEKHPIVILKDVPYADMKSLLDFMYRGEVSVDQERLTAFLKVAESLRIKGLTEVSDEKSAQLNSAATPPPQLHRIHPYYIQQKKTGMLLTNPVLSNALTMPKRKRGRPRKLSGSSNGTGEYEDYESNDNVVQGSSELIEVRMGSMEGGDENKRNSVDNEIRNDDSQQEQMDTTETNSTTCGNQPAAASSKESPNKDNENSTSDATANNGLLIPKEEPPEYNSVSILQQPSSITSSTSNIDTKSPIGIRNASNSFVTPQQQQSLSSKFLQQRFHSDSINNNFSDSFHTSNSVGEGSSLLSLNKSLVSSTPDKKSSSSLQENSKNKAAAAAIASSNNSDLDANEAIVNYLNNNMLPPQTGVFSTTTTNNISNSSDTVNSSNSNSSNNNNNNHNSGSRPAIRRRVRRKANSMPDDQTEQLTEMSVRGLNLFRYASISEGVYQCNECAKDNIQKTFKNKYSFQRHAFLYHEGTQRKVFPCPVCGKEFSRPDKMKNHMKTTHECYMPRDCTYPLNLLINTSTTGNSSTTTPSSELVKMSSKIGFISPTPQ